MCNVEEGLGQARVGRQGRLFKPNRERPAQSRREELPGGEQEESCHHRGQVSERAGGEECWHLLGWEEFR